jgi:T-complex protein 1 subunit theta
VIVLAGELLSKADTLLRMGLHVADVIEGFEIAIKKCLELLEGLVVKTVEDVTKNEELKNAIMSAISSKQNGYENLLGDLVVKACLDIMPANPKV